HRTVEPPRPPLAAMQRRRLAVLDRLAAADTDGPALDLHFEVVFAHARDLGDHDDVVAFAKDVERRIGARRAWAAAEPRARTERIDRLLKALHRVEGIRKYHRHGRLPITDPEKPGARPAEPRSPERSAPHRNLWPLRAPAVQAWLRPAGVPTSSGFHSPHCSRNRSSYRKSSPRSPLEQHGKPSKPDPFWRPAAHDVGAKKSGSSPP